MLGDYSLTLGKKTLIQLCNITKFITFKIFILVDVLDTLAIMGNKTEFQKAVKLVLGKTFCLAISRIKIFLKFNFTNIFPDHVNFDKSNTVQIFEANIRVLGGLLSAHLLMEDFHGMITHFLFTFF